MSGNSITEIRDPIHGFIPIFECELKIIDSPIFQRLRKIRQLAMAYFVYPGALHTRFEHSIGAMHLAGQMAQVLELNDDDRKIIRLSALLHDIGHTPFAHAGEKVIIEKAMDNIVTDHEELSRYIIENYKDKNFDLKEDIRNSIIKILSQSYEDEHVLCDIISGPIDVDKMDYLLRDCHYTGVQYGKYDPHQIIKSVTDIGLNPKTQGHPLAIFDEGIHAVEQFILARYFITQQVYYHRVRQISDLMIQNLLHEATNIPQIKELLSLESILSGCQMGDEELFFQIGFYDKVLSSKGLKLFKRLQTRHLLKEIFAEQNIENIIEDDVQKMQITNEIPKYELNLSERVAEEFKFDKELTFAKVYPQKPVLSGTYEKERNEIREFEKFFIVNKYLDSRKEFINVSRIFTEEHTNPEFSLHIYAPLDDIEPCMNARKKWVKDNRERIQKIIQGG